MQTQKRKDFQASFQTLKANVWAGILKLGVSNICIFDRTMDDSLYVNILNSLLPFSEKAFQGQDYYRTMTLNIQIVWLRLCKKKKSTRDEPQQ